MHEKRTRKTLMKLTAGVNFINVLLEAFRLEDPKSAKKTDNLTVFFALLGSASIKAASRTLMKLTPDRVLEHVLSSKLLQSKYIVYYKVVNLNISILQYITIQGLSWFFTHYFWIKQ